MKSEHWGSILRRMSDTGLLSVILNSKPTQHNVTWIMISCIIMLLESESKSFPINWIYTNIQRMAFVTLDESFDKHAIR